MPSILLDDDKRLEQRHAAEVLHPPCKRPRQFDKPMASTRTQPVSLDEAGLAELLSFVSLLDLGDPAGAVAQLEARYPLDGDTVAGISRALFAGMKEGTVCDRGGDDLRYSRLFGPSAASYELSADAVWMRTAGPHHTHPQGEVDLCLSDDGAPTFDGRAPGWTVYGPGSSHTPTVRGGSMMILYLLPGGAIEFTRR